MKAGLYIAPLLAALCGTAYAAPSPDSAVLKVEGAISSPTHQALALWDSAMLDQLPVHEIKTHTPGMTKPRPFAARCCKMYWPRSGQPANSSPLPRSMTTRYRCRQAMPSSIGSSSPARSMASHCRCVTKGRCSLSIRSINIPNCKTSSITVGLSGRSAR